ncbi:MULTISPECIES: N-acyl homoserine lactonase family protein [Microbacterium]|uniref:N-acyl homoserine lactonase family protein n=1 Tax=Microbacterium wangchenii TaxID=2541726 RepID=A0ABX5SW92_9MICO|nr:MULTISPECIES: N-acyl homoserine lactonase family protein [Microbacterium]MCK6066141.1 N-acyl homoserine lactonase family protein [Microbacterium sp. EYE_512]QBR90419.1 N-acyl homoserine lactonase family protein [Microbacterium wangchenii]TFV84774.1 N-acyl homoserine lactonase family protein [Microbacterium sp. dk485]TXK14444.1 N-acyl homoserine lactonase family protein [Microbacterium wangchenii]
MADVGIPEPFEAYAVRLGRIDRPARDNFLHARDLTGEMTMDFDMWFLRRGETIIAVDTGMSDRADPQRGRRLDRLPRDAAGELGIDPDAVSDLVITHLHYDHAGRIGDFPAARVWVQKSELDYVLGPDMGHPSLSHFFDVDDLKVVLERIFASSVRAIDGTRVLVPGVELHHIGGHTRGLQVVRVYTERGWVVIASDALHYYANHERRDPFPAVVDLPQMLEGYVRIEELADTWEHIIPGHDPEVMTRYACGDLPEGIVALHRPPAAR